MSDKETSWILSIIDQVTKPVKDIISTVKECTQVVDKSTDRIVFSEKQTKTALTKSKKYYKDLQQQIKENEKEVKELQKAYDKAAPGSSQLAAKKPLEASKKGLQELRESLQGAKEDIKNFENDLEKAVSKRENRTGVMTDINQTMEIINKVSSMLDFTEPIIKNRIEIQRMTQASGKELDDLTAKVHKIGTVFKDNDQDVARAAHSMQTTWGGSYDQMLSLLQKGYEKGADINKEMLDSMKEYPKQLKEAGLSASESMALIARANQQGVYSDKAVDSIKELNLALREMDKPQVDALKGIGITAKDIMGKTTFDVARLISEKMKGASSQAQQKVMADIFKAAGEDSGKEFVLGLASINLDINSIPSVKQAGAGIRGLLADIQSWAATTVGGFTPYLQTIGVFSNNVVGVISLIQTLGKVTVIQTAASQSAAAAQRVWNLVMVSNPIGATITTLAAFGAMIYKITKDVRENTESFKQQQSMMRINEELNQYAIRSTTERITKLKTLTQIAGDEKKSLDERKKALGELIKEDARYQAALKNGIILTDTLKRTTEQLTNEIYNQALVEGRKKLIAKTAEEVELAKLEESKQKKAYNEKSTVSLIGHSILDIVGMGMFPEYDSAIENRKEKERDLQNLSKQGAKDYLEEFKNKKPDVNNVDTTLSPESLLGDYFSSFAGKDKKGKKGREGREKDGLRISGGSGGSKTITQHLTVNNYFTRGKSGDDRSFSDKIITQINDGLRDAVATI